MWSVRDDLEGTGAGELTVASVHAFLIKNSRLPDGVRKSRGLDKGLLAAANTLTNTAVVQYSNSVIPVQLSGTSDIIASLGYLCIAQASLNELAHDESYVGKVTVGIGSRHRSPIIAPSQFG